MSNQLSKRLARLEAAIKPTAAWWNGLTWKDLITRWQGEAEKGLYLDFQNGQAVTFEQLHQVDPARAARLASVESYPDLSEELCQTD